MSNSPITRETILDKDGNPVPYARRYYYEGGTSTPLAVYSDRARTSAITQPAQANSHGVLPEIHLTPEVPYKIVTKKRNADGTDGITLETVDDIYAPRMSDDGEDDRRKEIAVTPIDQGADGDGAEDESTEVQAAITASLTAPGVTCDLVGGTYQVDSGLNGGSGLRIRNGELDFSECTDTELLAFEGTLGSGVSLSGNASHLDETLTASITGLAHGDLLEVSSTAGYAGDENGGELVEVDTTSGSTIQIKGTLEEDHATADSAAYRKLTPVEDVVIEDLTIIASEASSGANVVGISVKNARRVVIRNCRFRGIDVAGAAIRIAGCADVRVEGCVFEATSNTSGRGIIVMGACRNIEIASCAFRCEYGVVTNQVFDQGTIACAVGQVRGLHVHDCEMDTVAEAIYLARDTQGAWVRNNKIHGGGDAAYAIRVDCVNADVSGNIVTGAATNGILFGCFSTLSANHTGRAYWLRCIGNTVEGDSDSAIAFNSGDAGAAVADITRFEIRDNEVDGIIHFDQGSGSNHPSLVEVWITGNTSNAGTSLYDSASNYSTTKLWVEGNTFADLTISGDSGDIRSVTVRANHIPAGGDITIEAVGGPLHVLDNTVLDPTTTGISLAGAAGCQMVVRGNVVEGTPTDAAISVACEGQTVIAGNIVTVTDGDGIQVIDSGSQVGCQIVGNTVTCADTALHVSGWDSTDYGLVVAGNSFITTTTLTSEHAFDFQSGGCNGLQVSGNYFERASNSSGEVVHIEGSGGGALQGVVLSGNTFRGANYGLLVTNGATADVLNVGNSFLDVNQATPYSGTMTTANAIDN